MPRVCCLLLLVLSVLGWSSPAWATERLAVLELSGRELSADERGVLTDAVRGAIVSAAFGNIQVMTRENMEVMLSDMGMDANCISEGACDVETARNLGVDYVASGSVVRLSGTLVASLKIHETRTGQLLATGRAQASDVLGLLDPIGVAARDLVATVPAIAGRGRTGPLDLESDEDAIPIRSAPPEVMSPAEKLAAEAQAAKQKEADAAAQRERDAAEAVRLRAEAARIRKKQNLWNGIGIPAGAVVTGVGVPFLIDLYKTKSTATGQMLVGIGLPSIGVAVMITIPYNSIEKYKEAREDIKKAEELEAGVSAASRGGATFALSPLYTGETGGLLLTGSF